MSFYASVALNVKKRGREIVDGKGMAFEVAVHINI